MSFQFQSFPETKGYYDYAEQEFRYKTLGLPDNLEGKLIVDVGSAEGWFVGKFQQAGAEVIAYESGRDPNASWVDTSKVTWRKERFDTSLHSLYQRADYITILRVLYHMQNPILALESAFKMLKDDGVLYIDYWTPEFAQKNYINLVRDSDNSCRLVFSKEGLKYVLNFVGFKNITNLAIYKNGDWEIWKVEK